MTAFFENPGQEKTRKPGGVNKRQHGFLSLCKGQENHQLELIDNPIYRFEAFFHTFTVYLDLCSVHRVVGIV